ncbi:MAG: GNAT family N-acetyltransferase [Bacteroidales bacterium]|nr:GNAT family N-acetyltransferase [Bacteroidales bacterium]MCD8395114.1 GNAT family N-acetyltransferase [Bacteroidales bacterium]
MGNDENKEAAGVKIGLRALEPSDAMTIYLWENDQELWPSGRNTAPLSLAQVQGYISRYSADIHVDGELRLMIVHDGQAIGTVDLTDFDPVNRRAQLGILISKPYQRQGFGIQAIDLMEHYAAETLGLHQLWAIVARDNEASLALFRAKGWRAAGSLRSWLRRGVHYYDALIFQRLL